MRPDFIRALDLDVLETSLCQQLHQAGGRCPGFQRTEPRPRRRLANRFGRAK